MPEPAPPTPRIGLMLYTVRDECARAFEPTLREVAEMGYEGVELFDLHGHEPGEVASWLADTGLVACGRHASLDTIESQLPALAAEAEALGWRRLVVSWVDPARLGPELLAAPDGRGRGRGRHGLELGFHNHDAEVKPRDGGASFLDELLAGDDALPRARPRLGLVRRRRPGRAPRARPRPVPARAREGLPPAASRRAVVRARSATARSATSASPRPRSRRAPSGCSSSRTRRTGRRWRPRGARSRPSARWSPRWRLELAGPCRRRRLRRDQPPLRGEREGLRLLRARRVRRPRRVAGAGARSGARPQGRVRGRADRRPVDRRRPQPDSAGRARGGDPRLPRRGQARLHREAAGDDDRRGRRAPRRGRPARAADRVRAGHVPRQRLPGRRARCSTRARSGSRCRSAPPCSSAAQETWHPNPDIFFADGAGPLLDMGPYYLSAIVSLLGPVAPRRRLRVDADARAHDRDRPSRGRALRCRDSVASPRRWSSRVASPRTSSPASRRTDSTSATSRSTAPRACSRFPDPNGFDGPLRMRRGREGWQDVPFVARGDRDARGIGLHELVEAIAAGRPERASGSLGLHVVDVARSILIAAAESRIVDVDSRASQPEAMPVETTA